MLCVLWGSSISTQVLTENVGKSLPPELPDPPISHSCFCLPSTHVWLSCCNPWGDHHQTHLLGKPFPPPTPKPNEPIYMGFELCPCGDRIPIILPKRSNQVISNLNRLGAPSSISSPYFVEGLRLTWETFSNDHFPLAILSSGFPNSSAVKNSLQSTGSQRVRHDWVTELNWKNSPAMQEMQETQLPSLGWEDPLEEGMVTHSSILAWEIPWAEEPGGLQSMGSQRVGHDWSNWARMHIQSSYLYLNWSPSCSSRHLTTATWFSQNLLD